MAQSNNLSIQKVGNNAFIQRVNEKQDIADLRLRLAIVLKETSDFIGR
jgi:hypothetical protein